MVAELSLTKTIGINTAAPRAILAAIFLADVDISTSNLGPNTELTGGLCGSSELSLEPVHTMNLHSIVLRIVYVNQPALLLLTRL